MLNDVKVQKSKSSKKEPSSSSEKKDSSTGIKFRKVRKLKVLCHQPVRGDLIVTQSDNPYVIEVEPEVKEKKAKLKLKTIKELEKEREKEKIGVFDPRAHIQGVSGQKTSQGSSRDLKFLRPMPYNEKLRLGGRENSLAIAETQVSTREVLRGKYRKNFREYPTRRIESQRRRKIDMHPDFLKRDGLLLTSRKYKVMLTNQDRFVAEMAVAASGSLSLLGHNIRVVGGEVEQLVKREQIITRRNKRIEEVTYDVENNYELVKTPVEEVSDSSDPSSEEDQLRRSSRSSTVKSRKKRRKNDPQTRKKTRKNDPPAEEPDQLISEQNIKAEDKELDYGYQQDIEAGHNIWISWHFEIRTFDFRISSPSSRRRRRSQATRWTRRRRTSCWDSSLDHRRSPASVAREMRTFWRTS